MTSNTVSVNVIAQLMEGKRAPKQVKAPSFKQGFQLVRTESGLDKEAISTDLGKFEGRAGTTVRSSKGRTYRKANGQRYYVQAEREVVAYLAR